MIFLKLIEGVNIESFFVALNAVEEAALNRAKEGRKRLSEIHKNPTKKQGDIWEDTQRTSSYRVIFLSFLIRLPLCFLFTYKYLFLG